MIRHAYSVLCSKSTIDRETNNISLFEVLEQLQVSVQGANEMPHGIPFTAELVTLWVRADPSRPATGESRVRLLDPTGNELGSFTSKIELETFTRTRQQARLEGLRLTGNGWYGWEVSHRVSSTDDWTVATVLPLEISVELQPVKD